MISSTVPVSLSLLPLQTRRADVTKARRATNANSALLNCSSVSALLPFLRTKTRKRRAFSHHQTRFFQAVGMAESSYAENLPLKVIDSHLHVWAPSEQVQQFPYAPGQEPNIPGSVEKLLQVMEEGHVDGALIVQPINHKFDHSYLSSVLRRFPDKFVGCCLADPSQGDSGMMELERLVTKDAYRAVRFNPYLWPSNEKMTNPVGKALFAKAGQLGIPVGFMCFKGILLHIDEIEELCFQFPETTVILDHFGFCKPPVSESEVKAWNCLLDLSKFTNVYIKVSAFFRVSREKYPYKDTWLLVKHLVAKFGSKRLLWGSDFPFVVSECGYANARNIMFSIKKAIDLTDGDLEWIMGRTAMELFKGNWKNAVF